jgi:cytochrome oxidase Cu insertion factor (SCO1/SenC/PrrC family)
MYSITLDPEHDTVDVLRRHARHHGAGPGWLFLRPEPTDVTMLRRRLGFASRDPAVDARKETHVAMLRYGNEPRQLWAMTSAIIRPESIVKAIRWVDTTTREARA